MLPGDVYTDISFIDLIHVDRDDVHLGFDQTRLSGEALDEFGDYDIRMRTAIVGHNDGFDFLGITHCGDHCVGRHVPGAGRVCGQRIPTMVLWQVEVASAAVSFTVRDNFS